MATRRDLKSRESQFESGVGYQTMVPGAVRRPDQANTSLEVRLFTGTPYKYFHAPVPEPGPKELPAKQ